MNHDHNLSIKSEIEPHARRKQRRWSGTLTYLGLAPGGGTGSCMMAKPPGPSTTWPLARVYVLSGGAGPGVWVYRVPYCVPYCELFRELYCGPWCCGLSRRGARVHVSITTPEVGWVEDAYTDGHLVDAMDWWLEEKGVVVGNRKGIGILLDPIHDVWALGNYKDGNLNRTASLFLGLMIIKVQCRCARTTEIPRTASGAVWAGGRPCGVPAEGLPVVDARTRMCLSHGMQVTCF
jgi:hypothetical protein